MISKLSRNLNGNINEFRHTLILLMEPSMSARIHWVLYDFFSDNSSIYLTPTLSQFGQGSLRGLVMGTNLLLLKGLRDKFVQNQMRLLMRSVVWKGKMLLVVSLMNVAMVMYVLTFWIRYLTSWRIIKGIVSQMKCVEAVLR